MSYSFPVRRAVFIAASGLLLVALAVLAIAQIALPGVIAARFEDAIAKREGVRGGIDRVRVCVPCGSYTLVGPDISVRSGADWRPSFAAEEVVVSLLPGSLLRGAPAGGLRVVAPFFHFRAEGGAASEGWGEIVDVLLPVPIEEIAVRDGIVEVTNLQLDPQVRWRFSDVGLVGSNLTRSRAAPTAIKAKGRLGGEGELHADVVLPEAQGFRLDMTVRNVPVSMFNSFLRNGIGLDASAGSLDADGEIQADAEGGLEGTILCRVEGLDVLDLADLSWSRPLDVFWESFAASTLAAAGAFSEGALELELEIRESFGDPRLDAWSLLGTVLRRSFFGLLRSPGAALRWLAQRVTPSANG